MNCGNELPARGSDPARYHYIIGEKDQIKYFNQIIYVNANNFLSSSDVIYVVVVVAGLTHCENYKDFCSVCCFVEFVFCAL